MPSTWSTRFRLNYQAPGDNLNAWGLILNQQVFQPLEDAMAKRVAFPLSGTKTLTTENGLEDEARCAFLDVTGGTGGTIVIPPAEKIYLVRNGTSGAVTITTGAGVTAVVSAGAIVSVVSDAANVRLVRDSEVATRAYVEGIAFDSVGGLPDVAGNAGKYVYSDGVAATWREIIVGDVTGAAPVEAPSFTGGVAIDGSMKFMPITVSALNIDWSDGDLQTKSLSSSGTITFSGIMPGKAQVLILKLILAASAIPTWPAVVSWDNSNEPIFGSGTHLVGFVTFDGGTTIEGVVGGQAFG